ncbi:MAG: DUF4139 domain-containing protein [Lysobacterales bacterium]|jgi:hypothetical protein|nr:MAG: DUF4139 domain-containing protein [Xanthomonadales bacterium]
MIPVHLLLAAMSSSAPEYTLTVYSSAEPGSLDPTSLSEVSQQLPGYALIRDERTLELARGRQELRFTDVAARMDPTTVAFVSLTDPSGTRVLEQNYQFDLVSGQKLLERYLGRNITVLQVLGQETRKVSGELLSAQNGITLRLPSGEVSTLTSWHAIDYPALPGGLITKPTLVWLLDAARAGEHKVRVAYQALGLTWWADYNVILDEREGCRMDLSAWVTIVNQSGGSFPNASLRLVAGEVHRARPAAVKMRTITQEMMVGAAEMDGFEESELFEYHLYTLGRRTDLPDNSTKQIELFPAVVGANCRKQLVFTAAPEVRVFYAPNTDQGFAATQRGQANAFLEFENRAENRMGMPLPAGRVRVNQLAKDGSLEFIGEDTIRHTPRNETISLRLGTAFDIAGERRQTDFRSDFKGRWIEESFAIEVRNRKMEKATIILREYLYRWSGWKILEASHRYEKRDAQTIDFPIEVPADGTVSVRYKVRYDW